MHPGETIRSGAPDTCPDCNKKPIFEVCKSNAGYYIGTWCNCGPYSRETGYFKNRKDAEVALLQFDFNGKLENEREL